MRWSIVILMRKINYFQVNINKIKVNDNVWWFNVLLNNGGYNKIFLFMFLNISNILYINFTYIKI